MISVLALIALIVLLVVGVPIFVALGTVSLTMLALEGRPLFDAALVAVSGLNSSAFVAVLFFVVAAEFMQHGGIARDGATLAPMRTRPRYSLKSPSPRPLSKHRWPIILLFLPIAPNWRKVSARWTWLGC